MFIPIENKDIPIVVIDNFLPESYLNEVFSNIIDLKDFFSKSHWTSGVQENINPNCTGEDLWLPFSELEDEKNSKIGTPLAGIFKYFLHEGLTDFLSNCKDPDLSCWGKHQYNFLYHIINYKNGGYYNWHLDSKVEGMSWSGYEVSKKTTFTFALTLIKDESLLSGGNQLFMKEGKIVEVPSKNNQLIIFPSNIYHSLCEIKADENLPWEARRFNIQAWFCHL
jgi:hypothetical protein